MFDNYDINDFKVTLEGAYELYNQKPDDWMKMVKRAMRIDHSINSVSKKYIEFYKSIIEN